MTNPAVQERAEIGFAIRIRAALQGQSRLDQLELMQVQPADQERGPRQRGGHPCAR